MELIMNKVKTISSLTVIILNTLVWLLPILILVSSLFVDIEPIKSLVKEGFLLESTKTPLGYINLSTVTWNFISKSIFSFSRRFFRGMLISDK